MSKSPVRAAVEQAMEADRQENEQRVEALLSATVDAPAEYRYRNRHNGSVVTMVAAPMIAGLLYCYAEPWTGVDAAGDDVPCPERYRVTFGMPGRDGTTFDPVHWVQVS